ncbi:hypothetical protein BGZ52_003370 [Haplosporangium bisporale]|nr:hypothetical protein BGZ52_003370 [Haplosporangium bisporale]
MTCNNLSPIELLDMAREVLNVCSDHALKDILEDLEITNSSEQTINRIFDGQFLKIVERSPLPSLAEETKESKDVIMLLSSSDDESVKGECLMAVRTGETVSSCRSSKKTEITLDDDDDEGMLGRSLHSLRQSLERSLSPPSVINSDTDSEIERLMDDVFSGNKRSRAKKTPSRSSSKVQKKAKSKRFSLEELDAWGDDSYGNLSMSVEEEIAHRAALRRKRGSKASDPDSDGPRKPAQSQKRRQKANAELQEDERKAEQKAERDAKRAQKDAEKAHRDAEKAARALEAKKLRDLRLEEKDAEKKANRDLKIANRLTTKSDSVKEMVVCIEYSLQQTDVGKALQHYWTMLECGSVAIRALEFDISIPPNALGSVEGIPRETYLEPFTLVYLTGKEFALHIELGRLRTNLETVKKDMVARRNEDNLRKHGTSQESAPENGRVIYLIEGMETFIRGLKTNTTKKFRQAVLAQIQPDLLSGMGSNKNNMDDLEDPMVDRERIERELLWLQLEQDCLIIHTHDDVDSSQVVVSLTEQIGLTPYKKHQTKSDLNICVEGVKSGTDSEDIWIKTLQQIHMVTLPAAKAIASEYPSIRSLYEGYRRCRSVAEAQKMLAGLEIMGRVIGKSLSKRVYDVFMSDDAERSVT